MKATIENINKVIRDLSAMKVTINDLVDDTVSQLNGAKALLQEMKRDEATPPIILADISDPRAKQLITAVQNGEGVFGADLLLAADVANGMSTMYGINTGDPVATGRMIAKTKHFSKLAAQRTTGGDQKQLRLWVLRNYEMYESMSTRDRYEEYVRQVSQNAVPQSAQGFM